MMKIRATFSIPPATNAMNEIFFAKCSRRVVGSEHVPVASERRFDVRSYPGRGLEADPFLLCRGRAEANPDPPVPRACRTGSLLRPKNHQHLKLPPKQDRREGPDRHRCARMFRQHHRWKQTSVSASTCQDCYALLNFYSNSVRNYWTII